LADHFAPSGIVETWGATWNYGVVGKLQTLCATAGAALVILGVLEVAGRVLNVPQIQFLSKIAAWIQD
jgi:hypothetical protein